MNILTIDRLAFSYDPAASSTSGGFHLAVDSLSLDAGEKVAIVGHSGSGKSTLLNLIAGSLPVSNGSISIVGNNLNRATQGQLDRLRGDHLGLLFQSLNLLPFANAIDNVTAAGTFSASKRNAIKAIGQKPRDAAKALLYKLGFGVENDALFKRSVRQLSVGQQQRVAIARALYGSPALILADEPTSALDQQNRDQFLDVLLESIDHQYQALLMVTHDPDVVKRFDRVIDITA